MKIERRKGGKEIHFLRSLRTKVRWEACSPFFSFLYETIEFFFFFFLIFF